MLTEKMPAGTEARIKQIVECEEKLMETVRNSDVDSLDELLHDQLHFHIPNGVVGTKAMDLEAYRSGNMHVHEITPAERDITFIDDVAVVSVLVTLKAQYFEQKIDGKFRYLRVWKQFDGKWKIIAGSCIEMLNFE